VFEFAGLPPGSSHAVEARFTSGDTASLLCRTLPAEVPPGPGSSFNLLLVSCFHRAEDPSHLAGNVVKDLRGQYRPHATILLGDQVYLDLPTLQNFKDDELWLAGNFEEKYAANWWGTDGEGYVRVLSAAQSVGIPDDHEYWNNFPHASPIIQNSLTDEGRKRWRKAAAAMYGAFQRHYPAQTGESITFDVPPLSFFLADTRTFRDEKLGFSLPPGARNQLASWVDRAISQHLVPVIVTGQPLFAEKAGRFSGSVGDFNLSNYRDYPAIIRQLERLVDAGADVLCLTGDVHWGRVISARDRRGRPVLHEIVSSPSSLVTTVVRDELARLRGVGARLLGRKNNWPRHSDPEKPSEFLAFDVLGKKLRCDAGEAFPQKGNHVAVVSFSREGGGVKARITYWPVHDELRGPVEGPELRLTAA
jgi:hypothetical protein